MLIGRLKGLEGGEVSFACFFEGGDGKMRKLGLTLEGSTASETLFVASVGESGGFVFDCLGVVDAFALGGHETWDHVDEMAGCKGWSLGNGILG